MDALNRNELEAMRILWEQGRPLKPVEILADYSWPMENSTLRSVLAGLVAKRELVRRKQGKAFYYQPRTSREGALSRLTRSMAAIFTRGSTSDLIANLIENEELSPAEIEELRRVANRKIARSASVKHARGPRS